MEDDGFIEKVDHPTAWVNSLVIVEKKGGGLRICLGPRDTNKAIQREHYQLPTIEEIASRLSGSQVFTVLDANSAICFGKLN
ncbi:Retrovirus-related Pol polyprotein from transposon 297-like Protein [Biomphalaria pfeifferi]|uniref:Retrovirus-related Pol polyprotein from transposon 297-like Protein n=1 Tax=Biomphalaria pfeifferi TaxID=112525 RepID=A0AAD8C0M8_BIOPF|nr:Retrovirus-related Pol polyprotein from transposon 297-like Protein [Biomphalaria pfeifferi]